jgi:hypothetical protein
MPPRKLEVGDEVTRFRILDVGDRCFGPSRDTGNRIEKAVDFSLGRVDARACPHRPGSAGAVASAHLVSEFSDLVVGEAEEPHQIRVSAETAGPHSDPVLGREPGRNEGVRETFNGECRDERMQDATGQDRECWRVEETDSFLVITIQDSRMLLPPRSYRPGVGRTTLDFAGGRLKDPGMMAEVAEAIVRRKFNLGGGSLFASLERLNSVGWDVDSSSSSQRVYGVVAELTRDLCVPEQSIGASYPATAQGARELLRSLSCLQCRALVYKWLERAC